jgi:hypothetical protein
VIAASPAQPVEVRKSARVSFGATLMLWTTGLALAGAAIGAVIGVLVR